ncbi:activating signal cointegrator 1 complex subunit 1 [Orussus abietinus]|uniref:activating signal cointegrator 1 complex subunit 1 n=1 Tax=Orussus abietinus TaxID=222816 RepID=UPI000625F3DB|nr:activating signal cointegrator 1 complex subunit 1 [Orussus abietinus]XP_012274601.1 activating signal cointegrator 1 complex subunit 1 [Orussus abietinus]
MDVLHPQLVWVEGRCYRFFESDEWSKYRASATYEEEEYEPDINSADEFCNNDIEIVPFVGGKYKHSFYVARPFLPFIIGAKGSMRKKIEQETKTTLRIPKVEEDGDIEIVSFYRSGVISARHRIDLLMTSVRNKIHVTHFISLPLNCSNIIKGFTDFKDDVLNNCGKSARGICPELFQSPQRLHLTMVLLLLLDDAEQKRATEIFGACVQNVIKPFLEKSGPIIVQIQGIDCMNDDPANVRVLYAKVHSENEALNNLTGEIKKYFIENSNFVKQDDRDDQKVKLHMTVMNTKYIKDKDEALNSFDASNILKVHKDTLFGTVTLNTIHLSERGKSSNDEYYHATAKANLGNE